MRKYLYQVGTALLRYTGLATSDVVTEGLRNVENRLDGISNGITYRSIERSIVLGYQSGQRIGTHLTIARTEIGIADRVDVVAVILAGVPAVPRLYSIERLGFHSGIPFVEGVTYFGFTHLGSDVGAAINQLLNADKRLTSCCLLHCLTLILAASGQRKYQPHHQGRLHQLKLFHFYFYYMIRC